MAVNEPPVPPYPLEMLLGAGAGSGQSVGPLWESKDYRRGTFMSSCVSSPIRSSPLLIVLDIAPEQAATWEEMPTDSLGVASRYQANSPHPGMNSAKKSPDVQSRSKSHPWLSLMPTFHIPSLTPLYTPTI